MIVVCQVHVKAEDGDAPGTGNSLISFELDNQTTAGDANYFGVDVKSGDIWPRKKARELAQLSRRNYFRLTVSWQINNHLHIFLKGYCLRQSG